MCDCNNFKKKCQPPKMGTIYLITNLLNDKKYVGQTIQKLSRRMSKHRNSKGNSGIDAAIRKYGWENFKYEVIEVCPVEQLGEREKYWIAFYDCKSPKGYNLTDGGDGLLNPSQSVLDKMSASLKGKTLSESARKNLSVKNSGEGNPFYGKKHTPESLDKITAASRAYWAKHKGEKREPFSEEHCKNISISKSGKNNPNYGKRLPKETCDKISIANSGENNPMFGKHHSDETKAKISASVKATLAKKKSEKNLENLES